MSAPDPDETPRPETPRRSDGSADSRRFELPEDVDAAFAAIVADWADTDAPRWPDDPTAADEPSSGLGLATPPQGRPSAHPDPRPGDLFAEGSTPPDPRSPETPSDGPGTVPPPRPDDTRPARPALPDEHFVPPEPPPLPRIGLSSLVGLVLLVVGVVLLALPALVGGELAGLGIVPGLLAMAAGLGWLVVGMRRSSEDDPGTGPDDGGTL